MQARAVAERWVSENNKPTRLLCGPGPERMGGRGWSPQVTFDGATEDRPLHIILEYEDPDPAATSVPP